LVSPNSKVKILQVSILITNDREIKALNKKYRRKNRATDVLSFTARDAVGPLYSLGDIVISLETTLRQAKALDINPNQELLRLIIHGLLHLLGYEHVNTATKTAAKMRALEEIIYKRYRKQSKRFFTIA